jgi:hypothetical protein
LFLQIALARKERTGIGLDGEDVTIICLQLSMEYRASSVRPPVIEVLSGHFNAEDRREVLGHDSHARQHLRNGATSVADLAD